MTDTAKRPGSEIRRKQILDAAADVFGSKNYHWATTKEIAQEAGVSERTIFFYFKSKKALFQEVVKQTARDLLGAVLRATPPETDLRAFLKMSERNFLDFLNEYPLRVKLLFQTIDATGDPQIKDEFRKILQDLYNLFYVLMDDARKRGEIREDIGAGAAVVCMLGFHFIISYVELLDLDWFKSEEMNIFSLVDMFIDYITGRGV
jgi:AcrR family transcriptional regulator